MSKIPGQISGDIPQQIRERMQAIGQPDAAISVFLRHQARVQAGESATLREDAISPVERLPDIAELADHRAAGEAAVGQAVVIKLNGGLGTTMGMRKAKSLLEVRPGLSFLDVIARQVLAARTAGPVPLVLMNSFRTRDDSLERLADHPGLSVGLPLDFLQHQVPRLHAETLAPVGDPADPRTWCPPGHGDIYTALATSGMLGALRARGVRWAFVSNADNLGATLDLGILGYMAERQLPFLMEVTDRTESDRKGGHLARGADGGLLLREKAQCHPDDAEAFQDWRRHRYFNTNNLWVDLDALAERLDAEGGGLPLPLIRNSKRLDPADPDSTPVVQLETAMGAAIEVFAGAEAVRVPRTRFIAVKTCSDLLRLRSDIYAFEEGAEVRQVVPGAPPFVDLDPAWFGRVEQLEAQLPHGPPSLRACPRLVVRGDVRFGRDVRIVGPTTITAPAGASAAVPDGATLSGEIALPATGG